MKRIAIMVRSLEIGGAERFAADLSLGLEAAGYRVFLFLNDTRGIEYAHGGTVHRNSLYYKRGSRLNALLTFQHVLMTRRLKRKYRIDVTISVLEFQNLLNLMTPCGDRMIPSLHNYRLQHEVTPTRKDRLIERMFRGRLERAYVLVTVADALRDKLRALYNGAPERIVTVYNPCDTEGIRAAAAAPPPAAVAAFITAHTFVGVARHVEQKSLHQLVLAFALVAKRHATARLILVGEGPLTKRLKALANAKGLENRVMFTGFCDNPFPIVAACRCLVLSSHYEGFGLVLTEAMALGVPAVACDCLCGPREILAPGSSGPAAGAEIAPYGILTTPNDGAWAEEPDAATRALAQGMERMIVDEALWAEYARKAPQRAEAFSREAAAAAWVALIEGGEPD